MVYALSRKQADEANLIPDVNAQMRRLPTLKESMYVGKEIEYTNAI